MRDLNNNNIYAIPVGDFFNKELDKCYLIYAPLANVFFLALPEEIKNIEASIKNNEESELLKVLQDTSVYSNIKKYDSHYNSLATLYLLLNERCNFHCKYCYSAGGRSKQEMTIEQIKASIDYFLSSQRTGPNKRTVMFVGGGEPTLSWDLVREGTFYAEKVAAEQGVALCMRLSTNGAIMTDEMLDFYIEHKFQIQCSFEVLPNIQEFQRGSFEKVNKTLKRLTDAGIYCTVRSTITEENVDLMEDMVEFCYKEYPKIGALICECVVDPTYFKTTEIVDDFQQRYFKSFCKALNLAKKYNIVFQSSSYGALKQKRERFCFNLVCVTPYGTLTTCPNISAPHEEGYDKAVFGKIENGRIIFYDETYKRITHDNIHNLPKCKNCWARWNCGSGCPNQRRVYTPVIFDRICIHFKNMLRFYLMQELSEKYQKKTNRNFFEDISSKLQ